MPRTLIADIALWKDGCVANVQSYCYAISRL